MFKSKESNLIIIKYYVYINDCINIVNYMSYICLVSYKNKIYE